MYSENENFDEEFNENENNNNDNSLVGKFKDFYQSNKTLCLVAGCVLLLLIVVLMFNGCSNGNNKTPSDNNSVIKLVYDEEETLSIDNSVKLEVLVDTDEKINNLDWKWQSSDEKVVKVDQLGNVTALSLGEALVTASFDYGGKPYTATIKIIVAEGNKDVVVTSVKFPDGELLISTGDTYVLSKQVTPKNGYVTDITYTSSNNSVVEVSNNGEIKAKKVGVATIKMSVNNGKFEDEMTINVVSKKVEPQMIVKLETIQFNESSVSMKIGETKKLAYQTLPSDAYIDDLEWSSSNNSVASVDQNGNVTAKSSGSAVITVKGMNNLEATIVVNVAKGVVNVTSLRILSATNLTLNVYQTSIIVLDVSPYDATDKSVTYTSTSPSVASVENGTIRALTQGTTTIIVRTNDGGYSASINVTVVSSSGGSSGSGSGSSGSSGGSSSCTSNDLIRIDSDSGDAISTNKEGNGKTATKSVITIDTSLIGKYASCGTIETLKYCYTNYTGADCTPETEFKVGDKIKMNVPKGEGIMQIRIKASVNNGAEYTKTYYMKYKVDGTSDGGSSNDGSSNDGSSNTTSSESNITITAPYNNEGKKTIGTQDYYFTQIKITKSGSKNSIYFCVNKSTSTAVSPTSAITYTEWLVKTYKYQPSGTCNRATGLSSGYWNIWLPVGSKICAHAEVDGVVHKDYCKTIN